MAKVNDHAMKTCMPDLTVFLDVTPDAAFRRKGGVDKGDRLEMAGFDFHRKVYEGYKTLAEMFPERIVSFSTDGTKFETSAKIVAYLEEKGHF